MYKELVKKWMSSDYIDKKFKDNLIGLDEKELEDCFYKELEFGTGGLRGLIGSGTNRINIYTVGKVTKGYADFLNNQYKGQDISVAIAYDSRIKSDEFAKRIACILAFNNIKVYLYESLRPTPMLSFALRHLNCKGGIVITASHNPREYNGYKVYGEDGGQLTDNFAHKIYDFICDVDIFSEIKFLNEVDALNSGKLVYIGEEIDRIYLDKVKDLVIRKELLENYASELKIVYTPLHGSGYMPISRLLKEEGYSSLNIVEEQKIPDGNFPTVSYPNPEIKDVFKFGIELAKKVNGDIVFATDPDCDRVGVVCRTKKDEFKLFTGNQIGILLSEYILMSLKEKKQLSKKGVIIKTIVSTDLIKAICDFYKIELMEVLTGFKYIGEKIKEFEINKDYDYIFGFEESYGYLMGTFVRDKDAIIACNLIAEMALYYKNKGMMLDCALEEIYNKYGFFAEDLISIELKGKVGQEKIKTCIENLRVKNFVDIGGVRIERIQDYKLGVEKNFNNNSISKINLPNSNVIKVILENGNWFVVRPSGTEPKIKVYISVKCDTKDSLVHSIDEFKNDIFRLIDEFLK